MTPRRLIVILDVDSTETIPRIKEKVLCNLAKRTDSPPVYEVRRIRVVTTNGRTQVITQP